MEGNAFTENYVRDSITNGNIPPVKNATRDNYYFQSIYLKKTNEIIGLIDMYAGYPMDNVLWIGMFVIDKKYQKKGYAHEIIQTIENKIIEHNYNRIGIGVSLKNWQGLNFWINEGFNHVNGIFGDKEYSNNTFSIISLEKKLK